MLRRGGLSLSVWELMALSLLLAAFGLVVAVDLVKQPLDSDDAFSSLFELLTLGRRLA